MIELIGAQRKADSPLKHQIIPTLWNKMLINKDIDEKKSMMEELIVEDMDVVYLTFCSVWDAVVKRKWVIVAYSSIMSS